MNIQRIIVSILVLGALFALPASATTLTYTSQATLETNNTDLVFTIVDFSAFVGQSLLTSIDVGGLIFTDSGGTLSVFDSHTLKQTNGTGTISVTLPANALAFGVTLQNTPAFPITVDFTGDGIDSNNSITPTAYFGARDTTSLTGLTVSEGFNSQMTLSDFEIGSSSGGGGGGETPEAATLLMIGSGLFMLRLLRRWKRISQPA